MFKIPFVDVIAAVVITAALFLSWNTFLDNPKIAKAATAAERLAWELKQNELRREMAIQKEKAEREIDEIVQSYLRYDGRVDYQKLEEELNENPDLNSCIIPRSLSNKLNKIGRSRDQTR